ncbi:MAG: ABC transporter permease [Haloferacaceae archaeon]
MSRLGGNTADDSAFALRNLPFVGSLALVYLFLWGPTVLVIYIAFGQSASTTLPVREFSLRWFRVLAADSGIISALVNSLTVSAASAVIATTVGLVTSLALRDQFRGWKLLNFLSIAPLLMTRVVMGIALLIFFSAIGFPLGFWAVAVALGTLSAAYSTLIISGRLSEFDRSIEEAAVDLGASRFETLARITLPIIKPAIFSSLLVSFTAAFDELIIALFVQGFQFQVLPVAIFGRLRFKVTPEINAVAAVMTAFALVIMLLTYRIEKASDTGGI